MINNSKIQELLSRGVEEIITRQELEKKLQTGKSLRIKFGADPTSPNIHLGRSIPLLKLRDFQQLGHKIIFIIGDFTGVIGDTSDKDSERPMLSDDQVAQNLKTYREQVGKILDLEKCEVRYNSEWLEKLTYKEISRQANIFSVNEFISRENIKKRLDGGKRVSLREVLYPLMQGYDSVAIKADIEIGGTDQRFNILAGREMQKHYDQEPQSIITNPLIAGLDGRKMSSSWGNTINLTDGAREMFGKVMSLQDDLIIPYFKLTTRADLALIAEYEQSLKTGQNPRDIKILLAKEIVSFYHSPATANEEENFFINTFQKKVLPSDIPEFKPTDYTLLNFLIESKLAPSKNEARRLIDQGGVKVNEKVARDYELILSAGDILQKGKKTFFKVL